jgi:hypothetical protein
MTAWDREVGTVVTSVRMVRWLCWALVVLAIVSAIVTLLFASGILLPPVDVEDLVERLVGFRANDTNAFPFVVLGSLAALGVFLVGAILGTALRRWAASSPARDAMTLLFVIGGAIGIGANLLNIAVGQAATFGYCDCGYRTEELIAQDYALSLGWTAVNWLTLGAITMVGVGAAVAGRLLDFSPTWRTLSYLIAIVLLFGVALRLLAAFIFIQAFDPFQVSDIVVAFGAGILVPIWAILLAREVPRAAEGAAATA